MYDNELNLHDPSEWKHDRVLYHDVSAKHTLRRHRNQVYLLQEDGRLHQIAQFLMGRITSERFLRAAIDLLSAAGRKSPGPGGLPLEGLGDFERWSLARSIRADLQDGQYRPARPKFVSVPKAGKPGQSRTIAIQASADRVVGKSIALVLSPTVAPTTGTFDHAWRQDQGREEAIRCLRRLVEEQGRQVMVSLDVTNLFDSLPWAALERQLLRHWPEDVIQLIALTARCGPGNARGIWQGAPHSPLLANLFLDAYVDQPFAKTLPGSVLLRYVDDFLVPSVNLAEAERAASALRTLTSAAGLAIKAKGNAEIVDLRTSGASVDWLGFRLSLTETRKLRVNIAPAAWDRLDLRLAECHLYPLAPLRAIDAARGWIAAMGPALPAECPEHVLGEVIRLSSEHGFDEVGDGGELALAWNKALVRFDPRYSDQH